MRTRSRSVRSRTSGPAPTSATRSEIGNYAEIKNSRLGTHVRQHHMSYLGDADVGADTNVGAGTITANYDGVAKHRTTIGAGVFLGVDTMLRAPLTLGDGSKTGAGSVVTRDVPAGKLAVGVPARIREIRARRRRRADRATGPGQTRSRGPRRVNLPIGEILFLIILTLLEAVFVAAEIALVSIRRSRVEQLVDEGGPGPAASSGCSSDPGRFLAVIAARPHVHRLPRLRLRRREHRRRPRRRPRRLRHGAAPPTASRWSS